MQEMEVGRITHYYDRIGVGIIELSDILRVGDNIHIKGHTSDFTQGVDSIQIEHASVQEVKPKDVVGIKVIQKVHPHDKVYKVIP
jgi:putative protease